MYEIEEPKLEKKLWGAWATVGLGLVIIIVFSTVQSLAVIAVISPDMLSYLQSSPVQPDFYEMMNTMITLVTTRMGLIASVATCASAIIGVGFIALFAMIRKGIGIAEYLGLKRITVKQVLAVLGIMAGFIVLSDGLGLLLDSPASNEFVVNIDSTSVWPVLLWASLIIFAPIFEEAFFRGFLFEGFRQSRLGPVGAVLLTAFAWALLHIQYNLYGIATIFVMGILFGIVRIKTGSLWSTLIMHAFANMVALIQVALHLEGIISLPG
jgi:membrane protease YdiL (CAAX protease family)